MNPYTHVPILLYRDEIKKKDILDHLEFCIDHECHLSNIGLEYWAIINKWADKLISIENGV